MTDEQKKRFFDAQKEIRAICSDSAKKRIEQYEEGLLTFGELGKYLVEIEKTEKKAILALRKIFK